jgi:hypothetical protein
VVRAAKAAAEAASCWTRGETKEPQKMGHFTIEKHRKTCCSPAKKIDISIDLSDDFTIFHPKYRSKIWPFWGTLW